MLVAAAVLVPGALGLPTIAGATSAAFAPKPAPDVAMAVSGDGPGARTGTRSFSVVVRNLGSAATTDELRVSLAPGAGSDAVVAAQGDGWTCDAAAASCRSTAVLAPGATAPILTITTRGRSPQDGEGIDRLAATVRSASDRDADNDRSSASVALVGGTGVALLPAVQDAGLPADADGRGRFVVRVRNLGSQASRGTVSVLLGRTAGVADDAVVAEGPGWTCPSGAGRCTTTAVAAPDGTLPDLTVAVPRTADADVVQTLVARVSGGEDDDDRDDQSTGTRPADDTLEGRDLSVALRDVRPGATGGDASFEVEARNRSTSTRTRPTTVAIVAPSDASVEASGPGWTCTTALRCRTDAAVAAGAALPRITVRWTVRMSDADRYESPSIGRFSVAPASVDPGPAYGRSTVDVPVARLGADVVTTVQGTTPLIGRESTGVRTVVRNAGSRPTRGAVRVQLGQRESSADASAGPGWSCERSVCLHQGPIAPGADLPAIVTRERIPAADDDTDRQFYVDVATTEPLDDVDVHNDRTWGDGETAGAPADLAVAIEDTRPSAPGRAATAAVVVRNVGTAATDGEVVVRSLARMRGDGWTCGAVCRHPGPVPAGGRLPELRATLGLPQDRYGSDPQPTNSITARVQNRSDGNPRNDERSAEIADEPGPADGGGGAAPSSPRLVLQLDDAQASTDPRRGGTVVATVRNGGGPTDGPVVLTFPTSQGSLASATGPDWSCDAPGSLSLACRYDLPVAASGALPPVTFRTDPTYPNTTVTGSVALLGTPGSAEGDASLRVASLDPFRRGLLTAVDPVDPEGTDPGAFDVLVRNADDGPTRDRVQVDLPGYSGTQLGARTASGPGWACGLSRCVRDDALAAGETAPPIRIRDPGPDPTIFNPFGTGASVATATSEGRSASATSLGRRYPRAELRLSANGRREADGTPVVDVRLVNLGTVATGGPVELGAGPATPRPVAGDGWTCPEGGTACRLDRPLGPGEQAPVLRFLPTAVAGSRSTSTGVAAVAVGAGGVGTERASGLVTFSPQTTGVAADPTVDVEVPGPLRAGEQGTVSVLARNAGLLPTSGGTTLMLQLGAPAFGAPTDITFSGDGWRCSGPTLQITCSHPDPIPGAGALPPVTARYTAPVGLTSPLERVDLTAAINPFVPGDPVPDDNRAAASLGVSGTSGRLASTVHGVRPYRPGEAVRLGTTVRNLEGAAVAGPVELRFTSAPQGAVLSGPGWVCEGLVCQTPGPVPAFATLPDVQLLATAPASGSVEVATAVTPGTLADQGINGGRVSTSPAPRSVDLVPSLVVESPAVTGRDWVTSVRIANRGARIARGTTTVDLSGDEQFSPAVPLPAGAVAAGDGWTCAGLRCSTAAELPVGASLPPLRVVVPIADATRPVLTARVSTTADGAGSDLVRIASGRTAATAGPAALRSRVFSIGTASGRVRPGERVAVRVPIQGLEPFADRSATLAVDLPPALRYDGAGAGDPAPTVDGGRLTWRLRTPQDGEDRLLTFWAVVSPDAATGDRSLSGELTVDGRPSPERHRSDIAVVAPRIDDAPLAVLSGDATARLRLTGAVLHDDDRYELVRGSDVLVGRDVDGDDRRIEVEIDPRNAKSGTYDLVVRTTTGAVLRRADAYRVERDGPDPTPAGAGAGSAGSSGGSAGGTSGGGTVGTVAGGGAGTTGDQGLAALLAALAAGQRPPAATGSGSGSATTARRPTIRSVGTPRPPRIRALVRSGWAVKVRSSAATVVRVDLLADRTTARRLGVRVGTVLARAPTTAVRRAGTVTVRLRVPAAVRARVTRASRLRGTLRLRATSAGGSASASRRVTVRR